MRRLFIAFAALAVIASSQLFTATVAEAHERRAVGPYSFLVGFLNEPAFQGEPNAATVRITDTRANPPKNVESLEKTLTIEIRSGGLSDAFTGPTRAVFGQPGLYALDFIPTVGGSYTFTIKGKVEALDVNEKFESGPGRFNDVESQSALQYPAKVGAATDLAARLDGLEGDIRWLKVIAFTTLAVAIAFPIGLVTIARRR